jgi:folate-dependent phosphoribosylglycinamide formyltransferase PurN
MKKIILISTEDEDYFTPPAIKYLISNCKDMNINFFVVPGFLNIKRILFMLLMLNFKEIIEIVLFKIKKIFNNKEDVFFYKKFNKLKSVNSEEFINYINKNNIDLIVSYNNIQIFKKKTLESIKVNIANFHPGILPKYKGLFTNFYSLKNKENEIGMSFHKIIPKLDSGQTMDILKYKIEKNDTIFSLYKKLHLSMQTFQFIEKCIRNFDKIKDINLVLEDNYKYNSYPSLLSVIMFKFKK